MTKTRPLWSGDSSKRPNFKGLQIWWWYTFRDGPSLRIWGPNGRSQCVWEGGDQLETEGAEGQESAVRCYFKFTLAYNSSSFGFWTIDCHLVIFYISFHHRGVYSLLSWFEHNCIVQVKNLTTFILCYWAVSKYREPSKVLVWGCAEGPNPSRDFSRVNRLMLLILRC